MNAVQKTIASAKEFVSDHKVALAVVTTAAVTTVAVMKINKVAMKDLNDFLTEHELFDAYYNPGE